MGWRAGAGAKTGPNGAPMMYGGGDHGCSASCASASKAGTWSISAGRDHPTTLLNGIEPPERRSLGPATYDPRRGSAATRPNMGEGGNQSKAVRDFTRILTVGGCMAGAYIHKGIPDDAKIDITGAEGGAKSRPDSPQYGGAPRTPPRGGAGSPEHGSPSGTRSGARERKQFPSSENTLPNNRGEARKLLSHDVLQGKIIGGL